VVRYFLLTSHYRSPLNYTEENLQNAQAALTRFYTALRGVEAEGVAAVEGSEWQQRFDAAMDDDFNTPEALSVLFDLVREINRLNDSADAATEAHAQLLRQLAEILGLLQQDPDQFLKGESGEDGLSDAEIEQLIEDRANARANKDWGESDRIRDLFAEQGIVLEDGAGGTSWRRG